MERLAAQRHARITQTGRARPRLSALATLRGQSAVCVRLCDSRLADHRRGDRTAHRATRSFAASPLRSPSAAGFAAHWFGTDQFGRDILSRLVYGARLTLSIAILVVAIVVPIGLLIGTTSGFFGGWVDTVLMRAHRRRPRVPEDRARPRFRGGARAGCDQRGHRDLDHRVARLRPSRASGDPAARAGRLHPRRAVAGGVAVAHPRCAISGRSVHRR